MAKDYFDILAEQAQAAYEGWKRPNKWVIQAAIIFALVTYLLGY